MKNKILAMLLALCMVMALLPAAVFATDGEPGDDDQNNDTACSECGCDPKCSDCTTTCTCDEDNPCAGCKEDEEPPEQPTPCNVTGCTQNGKVHTDAHSFLCTCTDDNCNTAHVGHVSPYTGDAADPSGKCPACRTGGTGTDPVDPNYPKGCGSCGCTFTDCHNNCCTPIKGSDGKYTFNCECSKLQPCGGTCRYFNGGDDIDAPEGHCACDDSTCTAASHRGPGIGGVDAGNNGTIYDYYVCVNVPASGALCDACQAYADSKDGTAKPEEPSTPAQPSTPTAPARDPDAPQKAEDFSDIQPGQWYNDDVTTMVQKGWFIGQAGGKFAPGDATTGAEVVVILSRVLGQDLVTTGSAWAAEATSWAAQEGLTDGIEITTSGQLARQDLILMLWRAADKPDSSYELTFTDIGGVSGDALTALRWAVEKGIVKGNGDGTVSPGGATKRCEMAALMVRYDKAVNG